MYEDPDAVLSHLAEKMGPFFVGPIDAQEFLKPECSVYQEDCDEENFDISRVEFVIELKSGPEEDPFVDGELNPRLNSKEKLKSAEELVLELNPFVCAEGPTRKVLGQLTAYATAVLSAQYRMHTFTVFIVGEYARLIR
jgi:hypothetical protein